MCLGPWHSSPSELAPKLQSGISIPIRRSGETFWRTAAAVLAHGEPGKLDALIQGPLRAAVALRWQPKSGLLHATCTCSFFTQWRGICAHIWATILAADESYNFGGSYTSDSWIDSPRQALRLAPGFETPADRWNSLASSDSTAWRKRLKDFGSSLLEQLPRPEEKTWPEQRRIFYLLDLERSNQQDAVVVQLGYRTPQPNGELGLLELRVPEATSVGQLPDPEDRLLLAMISGSSTEVGFSGRFTHSAGSLESFSVPTVIQAEWLKGAADTGRLLTFESDCQDAKPLCWDPSEAWRMEVRVEERSSDLRLAGYLVRHDQVLPLTQPELLISTGLVGDRGQIALLERGKNSPWVRFLRQQGELLIPAEQRHLLVEQLLGLPEPPAIQLPEDLDLEEALGVPQPRLDLFASFSRSTRRTNIFGLLIFDYGDQQVTWRDHHRAILQTEPRRILRRDAAAENEFLERLKELGAKPGRARLDYRDRYNIRVYEFFLQELEETLCSEGWVIRFVSGPYRTKSSLSLQATNHSTGFELRGTVSFDDQVANLPELLQALQCHRSFLHFDDRSIGLIPKEWPTKFCPLVEVGNLYQRCMRYDRSQLGLLVGLLSIVPDIEIDQSLNEAHQEFARPSQAQAGQIPESLQAALSEEQKEGLGWLQGLCSSGYGGCLIEDDAGSRKEQILALLEERRQSLDSSTERHRQPPRPSLIVVPKSLLSTWHREIGRLIPEVLLLTYAGPRQHRRRHQLGVYDIVLTTYPILRQEISRFEEMRFDYLVLDEAQAIKKHQSVTTETCRAVPARHRVALLGKSDADRLSGLLSILDFLNPGLFGSDKRERIPRGIRVSRLSDLTSGRDSEQALWANLLKPFIHQAK